MRSRWLKSALQSGGAKIVSIPKGYRKTVRWIPHVGDVVPDFLANTLGGEVRFFDWAEGHWTYLINQPRIDGAVSTTELVAIAAAKKEFEARGVQVLSVTDGPLDEQQLWKERIERDFGVAVWFDMATDPEFEISEAFGMSHWSDSWAHALRKTILIDPSLQVQLILEYPMNMGRSVREMLRALDAQRLHRDTQLVTHSDWEPGDPGIVPIYMQDVVAWAKWGGAIYELSPGIRAVDMSDN